MCEVYERLRKDRLWQYALDLLDELYRNAEKAHPALPSSIKEIICSGVGRCADPNFPNENIGIWVVWYYLPMDRAEAILEKHKKRKRDRAKRALGEAFFLYGPTSNRKVFEKWKKELAQFKTLEEILEKYRR